LNELSESVPNTGRFQKEESDSLTDLIADSDQDSPFKLQNFIERISIPKRASEMTMQFVVQTYDMLEANPATGLAEE
jgi:hypothetical protein